MGHFADYFSRRNRGCRNGSRPICRRTLRLEPLEDRRLLTASVLYGHVVLPSNQPGASPSGLSPQQISAAYGIGSIQLGSVVGDGSGQTIAIVDAFDDPALVDSTDPNFLGSDLHKFDAAFGLADPPSFLKLDENGGQSLPSASGASGWSLEESLDVEWAHAVAPAANIVLVEANDATVPSVMDAVDTARRLPGVSVVCMSFGSGEVGSETSNDPTFTTPVGHEGVTFVAISGSGGSPGYYPAYSPNVLAVGGSTLTVFANGYGGETAWSGSGGGQSTVETEPGYQEPVQTSGRRQSPDVAFDADPSSGVAVYDSYDEGAGSPWIDVGGTSVGASCWSGLIAITNQLRASAGAFAARLGRRPPPSFTTCRPMIFTTSPAAATAVSRPVSAMTK